MSEVEFPKKLRFLFEPHRYKIVHGGRAAGKSWNFARALLLLGANRKLRILCGREIQKSLKESVMQLLADQIVLLNLGARYRVLDSEIRGDFGTQFMFAGLQGHTVDSVKSFEGVDITWIEEAQRVSGHSWDVVTPTVIRKPGSELWVSLNPDIATGETQVRFIDNPPPGAEVVQMNYYDNPFYTAESESVRAHDQATKPKEDYENIWLGKPKQSVDGAIYGSQMAMLRTLGRIGEVPFRRDVGVNAFFDLGLSSGNATAVWLHQRVGAADRFPWFNQWEGKGLRFIWEQLELVRAEHGFRWGVFYMPHDGKARVQGAEVQTREEILAEVARPEKIEVVSVGRTPDLALAIEAVRGKITDAFMDATGCKDGIKALEQYQYEWIEESKTWSRNPLHNWASNPADAFRTWAQGYSPEGPAGIQRQRETVYPRGVY